MDMVTPMSEQQESAVVDATSKAIKLANEGMDPSEAIAKVASEQNFNRNFATRMVEAYNVSKTLKHHKEASGDSRADEFPLADAAKVTAIMFPGAVETPAEVKASEWAPATCQETRFFDLDKAPLLSSKAAEPVNSWDRRDLDSLMKRAYWEVDRVELHTEMAREAKEAALEELHQSVMKLASYFKSTSHEPFDRFESAALQVFGSEVEPVMDMVWDCSKSAKLGEKRASGPAKVTPADLQPYQMLQNVMDLRDKSTSLAREWSKKASHSRKFKDLIDRCGRTFTKSGTSELLTGALANKAVSKLHQGTPGTYDALVTAIEALGDPSLEAERKSIRTRMLLRDLMQHDDVLRHADPVSVIDAFNEIASMAPAVVETPMALRTMLRKHVEQGQVAPEDVSSLLSIEKGTRELGAQDPLSSQTLDIIKGVTGGPGGGAGSPLGAAATAIQTRAGVL
jgi:hypothetical protein